MSTPAGRRRTLAAAVPLAVALSAAVGAAATATAVLPSDHPQRVKPRFLTGSELPHYDGYQPLTATRIKAGIPTPQYSCIAGVLPADKTTYRTYTAGNAETGEQVEARQLVTVASSTSKAKRLTEQTARSIERCAEETGERTTWKKYATHDIEDGLRVYGVFFAPTDSEYHLQMFGVGRHRKAVVVVALGQGGQRSDAPVNGFTTTAKRALEKVL